MTLETLKQCRSASLARTAVKRRIAELREEQQASAASDTTAICRTPEESRCHDSSDTLRHWNSFPPNTKKQLPHGQREPQK